MTQENIRDIILSWKKREGNVNSTKDILSWVNELNEKTHVNIEKISIDKSTSWRYDEKVGRIVNKSEKFFSISGMRWLIDGEIKAEQPIIMQPEVGYLGIICSKIDGVLNFLMQAKIEPGNVNCVQISPTIQATQSNYTRAHGGSEPLYLSYFTNVDADKVVYDCTQSEQGSRFFMKRNRNVIVKLGNDELSSFEVFSNFKWMTLGQIKELMRFDNLVNMDTRTVISGITLAEMFADFEEINEQNKNDIAYDKAKELLSNYKKTHEIDRKEIPLSTLTEWTTDRAGIRCSREADFEIGYYSIEIEGREVRKWDQPLLVAKGMATFALLKRNTEYGPELLIKLKPEIGCKDGAEFGPTAQWEPTETEKADTMIDKFVRRLIKDADDREIETNVILSEEGGRFYHEQNRNLIIDITDISAPENSPDEYMWIDLKTINKMILAGESINIQLRNLISLLDIRR